MRRTFATGIVLVCLALPRLLLAQDSLPAPAPTSAPEGTPAAPPMSTPTADSFRAGQWAAQFGWSGGIYGFGALHFTAPDRAWALSATVSGRWTDYPDTQDGYSSYGASLSIGKRRFRPGTARVRPFTELGLQLSAIQAQQTSGGNEQRSRGVGAGVYGAIGAQVFFTPELSLGAQWSAYLNAFRVKQSFNGTEVGSSTDYGIEAGRVSVVGAFYF